MHASATAFRNAVFGFLCVIALLLSFVQAMPVAKQPRLPVRPEDSTASSGPPMMNPTEEGLRNSETGYATRHVSPYLQLTYFAVPQACSPDAAARDRWADELV
ncbi:uncharacterized protein PHACADRAFT_181999 [Phanerochaete carnosa HHB-10118-sp]|uniref:Uncharacterized protein n=1 Tax=Phanerochaete carnosa (strain HHB-10118-sp) TaxID=650164 RepID=K5WDS0_PHACS|nr:uncharacterized protein PHACADRAFT_181999 [Phanerochaete carnosa HHB-10118-sp]EKM57420.1 hypothetical protein PHACADRAFT_181999 [Phanerochaete carnosa HHB-10118-sp]